MNRTTLFAICLVSATPALAQSTVEKTSANSILGRAPTTSDFVKEAAISDMCEIQASQLATQKGGAQTKTFAQQIPTDHQKTSSELQTIVASNGQGGHCPRNSTARTRRCSTPCAA